MSQDEAANAAPRFVQRCHIQHTIPPASTTPAATAESTNTPLLHQTCTLPHCTPENPCVACAYGKAALVLVATAATNPERRENTSMTTWLDLAPALHFAPLLYSAPVDAVQKSEVQRSTTCNEKGSRASATISVVGFTAHEHTGPVPHEKAAESATKKNLDAAENRSTSQVTAVSTKQSTSAADSGVRPPLVTHHCRPQTDDSLIAATVVLVVKRHDDHHYLSRCLCAMWPEEAQEIRAVRALSMIDDDYDHSAPYIDIEVSPPPRPIIAV